MPDLPFHREQLEFISSLASHRSPFLDPFFRFLNYFDSVYFFFALIPIIWIGFSYRWGLRTFYWFTLNSLVNTFAKNCFGWPRPSTDVPELGFFHPSSNGFPSGGAQISLFLAGLLIYRWRSPAAWVIGLGYALLISFSRLYLGVHYPLDLLGGWAIAALLLALFVFTKAPLEKWLSKQPPLFLLFLSLMIPLVVLLISQRDSINYMMGSVMGVGVGTYFSLRFHLFLSSPKTAREALGRSLFGIALLFLVVIGWPAEFWLKSFTVGLFMSLLASPIYRWLTR